MSTYSKSPESSEEHRSAEDRALDKFADMMIEKIKDISQDWKKPWFTEGSMTWPKNFDGREYNGMNALMLMLHCEKEGFKIPVFMTFDRVNGLNFKGGRKTGSTQALDKDGQPLPQVSVNKGSKSFPVFLTTFTVVDPETHEKIKYDDYKKLSNEEKAKYRVYPKLNVYNVFNIQQTNLAEARPDIYQKIVDANSVTMDKPERTGEEFSIPVVDEMIRSNKWICPIKPRYGDDAYYSISKDEIVVPEKKQFNEGESFYGTLFHEMTHSTGAESRLDRLKPTSFGSAEYAREELVAELGSALIAQRYGITKLIKEDSAAYLKSWLESLNESPDFIKTTLTDVKKATSMIIDVTEKVSLEMDHDVSQGQTSGVKSSKPEVKEENIAAKSVAEDKPVKPQFAVYSSGVGRYVTYVSSPVVRFGEKENALLFDTKEAAKGIARECKYYMPDERFSVREVKGVEQNASKEVSASKEQMASPLLDLGTYQIPQWSLNYLVNGEADGLTDEEIESVDRFVKNTFPNGFVMEIDWNDTNDFNRYPAFGPRNEKALTSRGESPYLATSTVAVQFRDPVLRENQAKQVSPDELGVVSHPNRDIWQVTLYGAYDTSDLEQLKQRARSLNGIPSSEDNKFYFLEEANARKFNHYPGAFQSLTKSETNANVETHTQSRMSDLVIEMRGEQRTPWITGKVDGQPVLAEQITAKEFKDYMDGNVPVETLGEKYFKNYLDQEPQQEVTRGMSR